jgi:hypothetical protein
MGPGPDDLLRPRDPAMTAGASARDRDTEPVPGSTLARECGIQAGPVVTNAGPGHAPTAYVAALMQGASGGGNGAGATMFRVSPGSG